MTVRTVQSETLGFDNQLVIQIQIRLQYDAIHMAVRFHGTTAPYTPAADGWKLLYEGDKFHQPAWKAADHPPLLSSRHRLCISVKEVRDHTQPAFIHEPLHNGIGCFLPAPGNVSRCSPAAGSSPR